MKKQNSTTYFIALLFIFLLQDKIHAQTIGPYLFGQNAWMPQYIGGTYLNGQLDYHWQEVNDSKCVSVRIGGIDYDQNDQTAAGYYAQLCALIHNIQINGGEPIVQVSFNDGAFTAAQACSLVTAINITNLGSPHQNKVKYWMIGNEPNGQYIPNSHNTAAAIKTYIQAFSIEMKHADPSILIIAPALTFYNPSLIMTALIGGGSDITMMITTSGYTNIDNLKYYVDYIAYHYYPFSSTNGSRALAISTITEPTGGFNWQLNDLTTKISNATSRPTSPLKIAITEGNINYANPSDVSSTGIGANSFIAGQFWSEMFASCMKYSVQFMNFWSVREGDVNLNPPDPNDRGYLRMSDGVKRPTYWHFKMLAENFSGTYYPNTTTPGANYKAFAFKNAANETGVIIMNQDEQSAPRGSDPTLVDFAVNFNNTVPITGTMKFAFNAGNTSIGILGTYSCAIQKETTMLLVFKADGTLIKNQVYGLSQALSDMGPLNIAGGGFTTNIIIQPQFNAYNSADVYSNITISPDINNITEISTDSKTFRFSNAATVITTLGYFEVPLGAECIFLPSTASCY